MWIWALSFPISTGAFSDFFFDFGRQSCPFLDLWREQRLALARKATSAAFRAKSVRALHPTNLSINPK
jgi:hypothetical protein